MSKKSHYIRSSRPLLKKKIFGYGMLPQIKLSLHNNYINKPVWFDAMCQHPPPPIPLDPHPKKVRQLVWAEDRLRKIYLKRNPNVANGPIR
jgi:hypothetical protein